TELDRRLLQFADDIEREQRLAGDAQAALARLAAEEETLGREIKLNDERRAGLDKRVAQADAVLARSEKTAAELTAALADLTARQALEVARSPLAEAERRAQRLDTEARTLAKLLHVDAKTLWPPALDHVSVDKGYEAALGAALGDDLEAPIDPSAPMRWAGAAVDPADPALPAGVEPLAQHVKAPAELSRRLAQIGVITREEASALAPLLKPGQRLVSREGD